MTLIFHMIGAKLDEIEEQLAQQSLSLLDYSCQRDRLVREALRQIAARFHLDVLDDSLWPYNGEVRLKSKTPLGTSFCTFLNECAPGSSAALPNAHVQHLTLHQVKALIQAIQEKSRVPVLRAKDALQLTRKALVC